ncbi:MAG TPA: hypothetical protein ENK39_02630 [Epsilonproteobacteria bacterium]|nr:hypothetical protein [Campylobacterota bacterium]
MGINDIIDEALTLNPKDRYLIINTLMSSLSEANDDLSHLDKEVEKGLNSKLSSKSHKEIFKNLKSKYV